MSQVPANARKTAGRTSVGMIVPGDALGLPTVGQRALWLPPSVQPGAPIDMALFDDWLVDRTIIEGLGHRVKDVTARVVRVQSGYLYHYAFAMLIGVAGLLTYFIVAGGR